jgi:hypothetical protein
MESQLDFAQSPIVGVDGHLRIERTGSRYRHETVELIGAGRNLERQLLLRTEAAILPSAPGEADYFDGAIGIVPHGDGKLRFSSGAKIGKLDVGLVDYEGRSGWWLREVTVTGHSNQSDARQNQTDGKNTKNHEPPSSE